LELGLRQVEFGQGNLAARTGVVQARQHSPGLHSVADLDGQLYEQAAAGEPQAHLVGRDHRAGAGRRNHQLAAANGGGL
jgi:hypothetical protein